MCACPAGGLGTAWAAAGSSFAVGLSARASASCWSCFPLFHVLGNQCPVHAGRCSSTCRGRGRQVRPGCGPGCLRAGRGLPQASPRKSVSLAGPPECGVSSSLQRAVRGLVPRPGSAAGGRPVQSPHPQPAASEAPGQGSRPGADGTTWCWRLGALRVPGGQLCPQPGPASASPTPCGRNALFSCWTPVDGRAGGHPSSLGTAVL